MMWNMSVDEALDKAVHLRALGETTIYVRSEDGFPFDKVKRVESGSAYRLGGPASCYLIAEQAGLTFKLNVDFEGQDANGRGVSLFDRERLRNLFVRLSPEGRAAFGDMLERECLPGLAKRRTELTEALNAQADSEDCVRGLILSARDLAAA